MRHYMTAHSTRLQRIPSRTDSLTDSLLQYFPAEDGETLETGNTPIAKEKILLDKVQSLLDSVQSKHHENLARLKRLDESLTQLSTTHERLHQTLKHSTQSVPPQRHGLTAAHCDYISAMIETSLVKVSLLRARAQHSLYGAKSQTRSGHEDTIASATATAYRKLKADEVQMREEERILDQKLKEYEDLLTLVDAGQGGFQQVVNDWTRVKKETEECRKDLRRLGWTGD